MVTSGRRSRTTVHTETTSRSTYEHPFLYITTPQTCCAGVMCEGLNANQPFTGVKSVVRANEPNSPVNVESADFTFHYFTS